MSQRVDKASTVTYSMHMRKKKIGFIERKERMRSLRATGMSYQNIGNVFGISRQRVHAILSGYQRLQSCARTNGWYAYIKNGIFMRDSHQCQKCGTNKKLIIHHIDGDARNNGLRNLVTLCPPCHAKLHSALRLLEEVDKGGLITE